MDVGLAFPNSVDDKRWDADASAPSLSVPGEGRTPCGAGPFGRSIDRESSVIDARGRELPMADRRTYHLRHAGQLRALGIVAERAAPYILLDGKRPPLQQSMRFGRKRRASLTPPADGEKTEAE